MKSMFSVLPPLGLNIMLSCGKISGAVSLHSNILSKYVAVYVFYEQKRKRPFSDVRTAPARRRWVGVAVHRGGFSRSAPLAAGDKGNTMNVSESLLTYRTEVKEVTLVAGRWSQT